MTKVTVSSSCQVKRIRMETNDISLKTSKQKDMKVRFSNLAQSKLQTMCSLNDSARKIRHKDLLSYSFPLQMLVTKKEVFLPPVKVQSAAGVTPEEQQNNKKPTHQSL